MSIAIRFPGSGRSVQVARGTLLIDAVRAAGLPIASSCDGNGLCGRCGVAILESAGPIPDEKPDELRAKRRNRVDAALRLACRLHADADLSISAPYW